MARISSELETEVTDLHTHMEKAATKVKETELLNARVKEYESLLLEQQELIEQDRERTRVLQLAEEQAAAEAAEAAAMEAEAAAVAAAAAAQEAEPSEEVEPVSVEPRWRRAEVAS